MTAQPEVVALLTDFDVERTGVTLQGWSTRLASAYTALMARQGRRRAAGYRETW